MFRYVNSDPVLVEAHARTQEAMYELERAIREAFERYDRLADRLEDFDRRLQAARVKCHAEPLSNGPNTARESASVAREPSQGAIRRGGYGSRPRAFSKRPAPA
jgi:hypothetical protein